MKDWLCGKCGGLLVYLAVAGLVAGGLGWATVAALSVEREQIAEHAEAEHASKIRLALWRLDSRIAPLLAREDSRPFDHYSAVSSPPLAFHNSGLAAAPGSFVVPSPLLHIDLPEWMLVHFQADPVQGWDSPEVLSEALARRLNNDHVKTPLNNVTAARRARLKTLSNGLSIPELRQAALEHSSATTFNETSLRLSPYVANNDVTQNGMTLNQNPYLNPLTQQAMNNYAEYGARKLQQTQRTNETRNSKEGANEEIAVLNSNRDGDGWFGFKPSKNALITETRVQLRPLTPFWMPVRDSDDHLLVVRLVKLNDREICQGIVLDDAYLTAELRKEVADLFPDARILPVKESVLPHPDRTMTALPFELDPGPAPPPPQAGWTPLRVGLSLAWSAALIALLAVGLGGWSLIDLSERRIRFVSAVTHELRTPLTTLRLYLDMLMNGLVRDEKQREEYIATLHAEAERLNRLVGNVLDFSRLEKQRPKLIYSPVSVADLLAHLQTTWQTRCTTAGKELILDSSLPADAVLHTDAELLQQVLGNLIDNACKYSHSAADRRIWLRARQVHQRLTFEVEDRGPGVPLSERRSIFWAFRRGRNADVTAGGVGLGLALAKRWARLLGGHLSLAATPAEGGACFRLELPLAAPPLAA
jgi:signal transduction histidine kinase